MKIEEAKAAESRVKPRHAELTERLMTLRNLVKEHLEPGDGRIEIQGLRVAEIGPISLLLRDAEANIQWARVRIA